MKNNRTFKSLPTYGQIESGLFHKPAVIRRSGQLFCRNCHTFHNNKKFDGYCCKSCWDGIEAK